jgi:hypothetical protein
MVKVWNLEERVKAGMGDILTIVQFAPFNLINASF